MLPLKSPYQKKRAAIQRIALSFFFVLMLTVPLSASLDAPPEIKDIIVTTSDVDLLLFATVKNGFTPEMIAELHQGIPIVFTYQMELIMTGSSFFDNTPLVESEVTHTMSYDEANRNYQVSFSNNNGKTVTTDDCNHAQQLMAELNGVQVIPLEKLVPEAHYSLHFKVTLKKGASSFGMQHLLPFSSLWDLETDWRTIEFRY